MELRSRFFTQFRGASLEKSGFVDDFRKLLALDETQRESFFESLPKLLTARDEGTLTTMITAIASQLKVPEATVSDCLDSARFLVNFIVESDEKEEDPGVWAEDFVGAGVASVSEQSALAVALRRLQEIAAKIQPRLKEEAAATGVLPVLNSIGSTVELRAVLSTRFQSGAVSLKEYKPSITGTIGIASIRITVDTGDDFAFQADEHALRALIESLEATRRELELFVASSRLVGKDEG